MSTQPAPALAPQPEPQPPAKEIPELTEAYRKAHKNYVLASGLLASWELIGITIQTKERWGIELKSPTAVPLILFVLVIYSGYKMTIEWMQCNPERKKHPAAKWDYRIAHGIALTANAISFIQYLLHLQIVDFISHHQYATSGIIVVLFVMFVTFGIFEIRYSGKDPKSSKALRWLFGVSILLSAVSATQALATRDYAYLWLAIPSTLNVLLYGFILYSIPNETKPTGP